MTASKLKRASIVLLVFAALAATRGDWSFAGGVFAGWYVMLISLDTKETEAR